MITTFETEKKLWFVWQIFSSFLFPVICLTILFATPVYEKSLFLTILLFGICILAIYIVFVSKSVKEIFSLVFDDENRILHIVYYKQTFTRLESFIPYDKLWYYKSQRGVDVFLGTFSGFGIQMRDYRNSSSQIEFDYLLGGISGAFSEKQIYQIIDKLKEVGHNYFEEHERKWGTTLF